MELFTAAVAAVGAVALAWYAAFRRLALGKGGLAAAGAMSAWMVLAYDAPRSSSRSHVEGDLVTPVTT